MWEALRRLRKRHKMTQAELAVEARVSQSYVSQLENGYEKNPTVEVIEALAKALSVGIGELIGEGEQFGGQDHEGIRSQEKGNGRSGHDIGIIPPGDGAVVPRA